MKDKEFLQWMHDRLIYVHGENKNVDYLHKLRCIIETIDEDQSTPNIINSHETKDKENDIRRFT